MDDGEAADSDRKGEDEDDRSREFLECACWEEEVVLCRGRVGCFETVLGAITCR